MTGESRPGQIGTPHGVLTLPAFLPDATRGVVKCLDADGVRAAGIEGVCVNTLHLAAHPGTRTLAALGGIHRFMDWRGPVLSDSGGFQVHSLAAAEGGSSRATRKGFEYRVKAGGDRKRLTPAKCIQYQWRIGSDILVTLDHFTPVDGDADARRTSIENTVAWARACRAEFDQLRERTGRSPLLFAVVQGGEDAALRKECAGRLLEIGFDGFGYGGMPVDGEGRLRDSVAQVAELIPRRFPLWGLGIGSPEHVARGAALGYGIFDCVLPTRDARSLRGYRFRDAAGRGVEYERLYLQDKDHARSDAPLDPSCDAACCRAHSAAYLHHLFRIKEPLGARLLTLHNLRFYARLLERMRG